MQFQNYFSSKAAWVYSTCTLTLFTRIQIFCSWSLLLLFVLCMSFKWHNIKLELNQTNITCPTVGFFFLKCIQQSCTQFLIKLMFVIHKGMTGCQSCNSVPSFLYGWRRKQGWFMWQISNTSLVKGDPTWLWLESSNLKQKYTPFA